MSHEELIDFLRENLRLDIETTSEYNGGMNDGPMYTQRHSIQLTLDGEVISSVSL